MKPFRYCPACGAPLDEPDNEGGAHCSSCERSWYRNSAPTAGAAIVQDGRALVTKRAREPEKGRFDVPGGFLLPGEHPIEGLRREVKEELGVEIHVDERDCLQMIPHRYGDEGDFVLALGFKGGISSGEPRANDDVDAIRWVTKGELEDIDFAWPHDRDLVMKALDEGETDG